MFGVRKHYNGETVRLIHLQALPGARRLFLEPCFYSVQQAALFGSQMPLTIAGENCGCNRFL
jgi:hypothetical protein